MNMKHVSIVGTWTESDWGFHHSPTRYLRIQQRPIQISKN